MEYTRQSDLKVTCIATVDDMDFFGITVDDILDRTEAGLHFLKKSGIVERPKQLLDDSSITRYRLPCFHTEVCHLDSARRFLIILRI